MNSSNCDQCTYGIISHGNTICTCRPLHPLPGDSANLQESIDAWKLDRLGKCPGYEHWEVGKQRKNKATARAEEIKSESHKKNTAPAEAPVSDAKEQNERIQVYDQLIAEMQLVRDAFDPVLDWYKGGGEGPDRSFVDMLRDAITDLQDDRKRSLQLCAENKKLEKLLAANEGRIKNVIDEQLHAENERLRKKIKLVQAVLRE